MRNPHPDDGALLVLDVSPAMLPFGVCSPAQRRASAFTCLILGLGKDFATARRNWRVGGMNLSVGQWTAVDDQIVIEPETETILKT